jgi:hypothetical protein
VSHLLNLDNAATEGDDAVTKTCVDDSKRSLTWLTLSGRPAWTNYISLSGMTATATAGNNN